MGLGSCRRQRRAVDGIRRLSEVDERVQLRENGAERRGREGENTEEKEKKQEKCGSHNVCDCSNGYNILSSQTYLERFSSGSLKTYAPLPYA